MPQPIESLDRPTLERRYRRMRLATTLLAAVSVVLGLALGLQGARGSQGEVGDTASDTATTSGSESTTSAEQCPVADRRDPNDPRALGDVDAPVVLHEWTDFRCPYCGSFSRDTLPTIISEYVDTGKVRLEVHDAALVGGENSVLIAAAARAAGDQGRYFEFYDAVYQAATKQSDSHPEFDVDALVDLARTAGVKDIDGFRASVESREHEDAVRAETAEAQSIGVQGVPFFATSGCGQVVSGAHELDAFRTAIDAAVDAAGSSTQG